MKKPALPTTKAAGTAFAASSADDPAPTLSTFTASDGDNLALHDWPLPPRARLRGMVLLVHGLGEHAGRHDRLARRLVRWGFAVRSYDQYGHGESGGTRGGLPTPMRLVDDLVEMVESARLRTPDGLPLILFGHSLGGLVAARYALQYPRTIDALVLSSPALRPRLSALQRWLLRIVPRVAPQLRVRNGVQPRWLTHDDAVVRAYRADPLVHDRISGRLGRFIADESLYVMERAVGWRVPTLLLYAGLDHLVDPAGSRRFAEAAPPELVTGICFERLFHEVFNEAAAQPVFRALREWLDARWP